MFDNKEDYAGCEDLLGNVFLWSFICFIGYGVACFHLLSLIVYKH